MFKHLAVATLVVVIALYGYRLIAAQEPQQTFGLTCTITGQEVVCTGTLPQPSASPVAAASATLIAVNTVTPSAPVAPTFTQTPSPTLTSTAAATSTDTASPTITRTPTPVPTATTTPTVAPPASLCDNGATVALDTEEQTFLTLLNAYRAETGLHALVTSPTLQRAAAWKSRDLGVNAYLAHDDLFRTWSQRLKDCGYNNGSAKGENIGAGYELAAPLLAAFKLSPGHNGLLLAPDYFAIGIGREFVAGSPYGWYWTLDFGGFVDDLPPTPTPTVPSPPTPTPSAYTVEQLISDSTGPHAGTICGIGGYDWQSNGVIQSASPAGRPQATGWFAANWNCGSNVAGVRYQVRNLRLLALTSVGWTQVGSGIGWCAIMNPPTNAFAGSGCNLSGDWPMPNASQSIHGSTARVAIPSGTQCLVTLGEQRITGTGYVIANFGADYISSSGGIGGAVVGRYRRLTNDWQSYGVSSCPAATLRANPPPGVN